MSRTISVAVFWLEDWLSDFGCARFTVTGDSKKDWGGWVGILLYSMPLSRGRGNGLIVYEFGVSFGPVGAHFGCPFVSLWEATFGIHPSGAQLGPFRFILDQFGDFFKKQLLTRTASFS